MFVFATTIVFVFLNPSNLLTYFVILIIVRSVCNTSTKKTFKEEEEEWWAGGQTAIDFANVVNSLVRCRLGLGCVAILTH